MGEVSRFTMSFSVAIYKAQFPLWQKRNFHKKKNDIDSQSLKDNISFFNISSLSYLRCDEISVIVKFAILKEDWVVRSKLSMSY